MVFHPDAVGPLAQFNQASVGKCLPHISWSCERIRQRLGSYHFSQALVGLFLVLVETGLLILPEVQN